MAALEPVDTADPRLKSMVETMYLSKNPELKAIAGTMDSVKENDTLLDIILTNDWPALDGYFREMSGVDNFLKNLQQLLIFKYRIGLTRKQFQIAMGIQQMVWMTDPENCVIKKLSQPPPTSKFVMWEDIPPEEKPSILTKIHNKIKKRYRGEVSLDGFFNGTVWYSVENITSDIWGGYGTSEQYYPIPETLNFTRIANIYVPELIFGVLGDITLTEHIATRSSRPYIANLPSKGICDLHNRRFHICTTWIHDFGHASADNGRLDLYSSTLESLLPFRHWTKEHPEYNDSSKALSTIISEKQPVGDDLIAAEKLQASRYMNDTGWIWEPVVTVEGGKKRASRRARSRRRPIAVSRTSRRVASRLSLRKTRNNILSALR